MCKARDVAMAMIKKSIALAKDENNNAYFMDFVKLHKLMYLGQCHYLASHDEGALFEEIVTAHHCGPYIDGLNFITAEYGFGEIKSIEKEDETVPFHLPISISRDETLDFILKKFGTFSTEEIIQEAKNTPAYQAAEILDNPAEITQAAMKQTGAALFLQN